MCMQAECTCLLKVMVTQGSWRLNAAGSSRSLRPVRRCSHDEQCARLWRGGQRVQRRHRGLLQSNRGHPCWGRRAVHPRWCAAAAIKSCFRRPGHEAIARSSEFLPLQPLPRTMLWSAAPTCFRLCNDSCHSRSAAADSGCMPFPCRGAPRGVCPRSALWNVTLESNSANRETIMSG